jgi:hypothetical protein
MSEPPVRSAAPRSSTTWSHKTDDSFKYEQISWHDYRKQVVAIAVEVFSRPAANISINRMRGGAYNRVTGIALGDSVKDDFVIRIPRDPDVTISHSTNILRYLSKHTPLPVPVVVAEHQAPRQAESNVQDHSTSTSETRDFSYSIMEKLPGHNLFHVYKSFTYKQKLDMARQFAHLIADIFAIKVPSCIGNIEVNSEGELTVRSFIYMKQLYYGKGTFPPIEPSASDMEERLDIGQYFAKIFSFLERSTKCTVPSSSYTHQTFERLQRAARMLLDSDELSEYSRLPPVFVHADLAARNVLVMPPTNGSDAWTISGVMDWDICRALPPLAAYWCPAWLWRTNGDTNSSSSSDQHYNVLEFNDNPDDEPTSEEERAIKAIFVKTIEGCLPEYMTIVRLGRQAMVKQFVYLATHYLCDPFGYDTVDSILEAAGIEDPVRELCK